MAARGLGDVAAKFGLGYVHSAPPGHERYTGHLVLPYMRPAGGDNGVATLRFRCIKDECVRAPDGRFWFEHDQKEQHQGHGKYQSLPGDPPRLFNTAALLVESPHIVLVEGEADAMAWDVAGVPAAGMPGTGTWRDYWHPAFYGYQSVFLIAEDEAGEACMDALASEMPNGKPIRLPDIDSNTLLLTEGPQALRERIGL
ncbi:topoisomerase [Streptomyces wuyuanensis]|uniref:topoisomerase n=1 Tax=Streptomyces wuyuanensis TaxID=1196353 RepID=UPI0034260E23